MGAGAVSQAVALEARGCQRSCRLCHAEAAEVQGLACITREVALPFQQAATACLRQLLSHKLAVLGLVCAGRQYSHWTPA